MHLHIPAPVGVMAAVIPAWPLTGNVCTHTIHDNTIIPPFPQDSKDFFGKTGVALFYSVTLENYTLDRGFYKEFFGEYCRGLSVWPPAHRGLRPGGNLEFDIWDFLTQ